MTARLDWYGCATFRLTLGSLVLFLDAYIDRVPGAAGTGLRADDIEQADWIVVGHSHFDHLWGAERIAKRTGATIIGSHETVRIIEHEGVPLAQLLPVGGGERIRLSSDVTVAVYPCLHSCVVDPQGGMFQPDEVCLGDLGVTYQERMARLQEVMQGLATLSPEVLSHLQASAQGVRGDGGRSCTCSRRRKARCSTRTPPGTGAGSCTTCAPMSPSWPRPGGATSTASPSRAHSPSSSPGRPSCSARGA